MCVTRMKKRSANQRNIKFDRSENANASCTYFLDLARFVLAVLVDELERRRYLLLCFLVIADIYYVAGVLFGIDRGQ